MEEVLLKKIKGIITSYPGGTSLLQEKTLEMKKPSGYTMRYIQMILNGDRENSVILDMAVDVAGYIIREKKKVEKQKEKKRKKQMAKLEALQKKQKNG